MENAKAKKSSQRDIVNWWTNSRTGSIRAPVKLFRGRSVEEMPIGDPTQMNRRADFIETKAGLVTDGINQKLKAMARRTKLRLRLKKAQKDGKAEDEDKKDASKRNKTISFSFAKNSSILQNRPPRNRRMSAVGMHEVPHKTESFMSRKVAEFKRMAKSNKNTVRPIRQLHIEQQQEEEEEQADPRTTSLKRKLQMREDKAKVDRAQKERDDIIAAAMGNTVPFGRANRTRAAGTARARQGARGSQRISQRSSSGEAKKIGDLGGAIPGLIEDLD